MVKLYVINDYKSILPGLKGKALTDALIRRCLGNEDLAIRRTELGKPYLSCAEGNGAAPYISVSHSEETFALAVSDAEIGLDIQYAKNANLTAIAARCFAEEDARAVAEDRTGKRFFELWTRKEAYSKYTGAGIEQVLKRESVTADEDVRFIDFRLEDGCFCSICIGTGEGDQSDEIQISYGE